MLGEIVVVMVIFSSLTLRMLSLCRSNLYASRIGIWLEFDLPGGNLHISDARAELLTELVVLHSF